MNKIYDFIIEVPLAQSEIFPYVIWGFFILSLFLILILNIMKIKEYKTNIDNLIYDDYLDGVSFNTTPGILMSIGIIGTFYLIYHSLGNLNGNIEIENMLSVITNNIAPAFSISALGIFTSILYTFAEKTLIYFSYSSRIEKLKLNKSKRTYTNFATEELKTSKEILKATQLQTETFESLNDFSSGLKGMTQSIAKFGEIANTLEKTLNPQMLGEVISSALLKEMTPVLNNIQSITSNVDNNSQKITKFLEEDLKNDVIQPLLESVKSTDESTKEMKDVLEKTSQVMAQTNSGFDKILLNLNTLQESQDNFVNNLKQTLIEQRMEFEKTTNTITSTYNSLTNTVSNQTNIFEENSKIILDSFTSLSTEMKEFLIGYKEDYRELLTNQEKAIKETSEKAVEILDKSGKIASKTITDASDKLEGTLDGVDEALIKTSESITEKLTEFKDSYTDTLKGFLDSQADELHRVFGEHTEKLKDVVVGFKDTLESDVDKRKILNEDLEKLVKTTNGFVSSTQSMITTAFDEQQKQLVEFMENNKSMQSKLTHIVDNASDINDNGNVLTRELISTTANLQKQFNDNQTEILKKYQIEVDEHLKDILNYMAAIIEASHINN